LGDLDRAGLRVVAVEPYVRDVLVEHRVATEFDVEAGGGGVPHRWVREAVHGLALVLQVLEGRPTRGVVLDEERGAGKAAVVVDERTHRDGAGHAGLRANNVEAGDPG